MSYLKKTVIDKGLCVGCGVCASAKDNSPYTIKFNEDGKYQAFLKDKDGDEDYYSKVCPFSNRSKNEDEISGSLFSDLKKDKNLGYYSNCYVGGSNSEYRSNSSSGGLATFLSIYLLEHNIVDEVIHVRESDDISSIYSYSSSKTKQDILKGSKSKYYPVTLEDSINQLKKSDKRFAIIGIPCFIKAMRLLSDENESIKDKIKFLIGINCGHLKSKFFAESLAWQLGADPNKLLDVDFRNSLEGWSNRDYGFKASYKGLKGGIKTISSKYPSKYLFGEDWGLGFFKYKSCDFCDDVFAETADIVLGDAWIKPFSERSLGTNVVITRNKELEKILIDSKTNGLIELEEITSDQAVSTQSASIRHRRSGLSYRLKKMEIESDFVLKKRVKPQIDIENNNFNEQHNLREKIRDSSFKYFKEAKSNNNYDFFRNRMIKIITPYYKLKTENKFKFIFGLSFLNKIKIIKALISNYLRNTRE